MNSVTAHPGETQPSVNKALTVNAQREVVETDEFGKFARRVIRAYSRRVADGDVEALGQLVTLSDSVDQAIIDAIAGLREFGYSWAEIASRLGMTRQGVQQRWGKR